MRVLQVGLGPLGRAVAADLVARGHVLAAAVDVDPELAGRALGELDPRLGALDLRVQDDLERALATRCDAAVVTTVSDLAVQAPTLGALLGRGLTVVSTCEELFWPWLRHLVLAQELHERALRGGGRLVGTGVNPGFVMDALPLFASAVCTRVRAVEVARIQDASTRRLPFQRKIGAGLDTRAFARAARAGSLRHVGLGESLHFLAHHLGFALEGWEETLEPVLAERELASDLGPIPAGFAAGVSQVAVGRSAGRDVVRLEFRAAIGEPEPLDRVRIDGDPPIELRVPGGIHGDRATSAVVANCLPALRSVAPGLHTMASLPLPHCSAPRGARRSEQAG